MNFHSPLFVLKQSNWFNPIPNGVIISRKQHLSKEYNENYNDFPLKSTNSFLHISILSYLFFSSLLTSYHPSSLLFYFILLTWLLALLIQPMPRRFLHIWLHSLWHIYLILHLAFRQQTPNMPNWVSLWRPCQLDI